MTGILCHSGISYVGEWPDDISGALSGDVPHCFTLYVVLGAPFRQDALFLTLEPGHSRLYVAGEGRQPGCHQGVEVKIAWA